MEKHDVVVIGGGPAGLAAAIAARENGAADVVLLERDALAGGILRQCIHAGFGLHIFGEELTGPEYAERFRRQAEEKGIVCKTGTMVLSVDTSRVITAVNPEDGVFQIRAGAVVLAMGCRERSRGAIGIAGTRPAGIFTAGTAQRFVNMEGYMPGKKVVILGSGDIGLIMARRMSLEGARVEMVLEAMPFSGGLKRNIVQCLDDFGIPLLLSHTVVEVLGRERVEGVVIAQLDENRKPIPETFRTVECDTLLLSVGLIPENELTREAGIAVNPVTSGPFVSQAMETCADGIFACGNVVHVHDLVDYVTEESRIAGRGAARFAAGEMKKTSRIETQAGHGVRYVVPNWIEKDGLEGDEKLLFRVDNVYQNVDLVVKSGEQEILRRHLAAAAPGEMESVRLVPALVKQLGDAPLTVSLEGS